MGMFDSVFEKCPNCGEIIEMQSKAGDCILCSYNLYNAPLAILLDLANDTIYCPKCGKLLKVLVQSIVVGKLVINEDV